MMEEFPECEIDIGEKNSSLKPFHDDDHNTVSTLNDSTLEHGDQSGNISTDDLPLVQRIDSTLSDSQLEESLVSFGGLGQPPSRLQQPEPWQSVATQAILQKLNVEYQRQRIRLGELRSRNDLVLAGVNWKRNLHAKDFKFRLLIRRIAELQARNQELMQRQANQGVLQQKLEAAQRQIKILQSAWNQTLDLHMAELDISDDFVWQPLLAPPPPHARHSREQRRYAKQPSTNSTAAPQVSEISQIWQQDAAATATAIPVASQIPDASSFATPREGRGEAKSREEPENKQQTTHFQGTIKQSSDTNVVKDALKATTEQDSPHATCNSSPATKEENVTAQLQEEITSLHAASTAQKVEMAQICYDFLQEKARHERQFATLETKHHQALAQIEQLQAENIDLVQVEQLMKASLSQYQLSISSLCKKQSNLFLEVEEKTKKLDQAELEIVRLESMVEQQRQESLGLQDQVFVQQQELMEMVHLKASNESLSTQCQTLEQSLSQSSRHVSHLESVIAQLQSKLQEAEKSHSRMKAENERLTRECQETKRKHQLQTQKSPDADCISEVHASIFGFW